LQYTEVLGKGAFKTVYPFVVAIHLLPWITEFFQALTRDSDLFDSSWLDQDSILRSPPRVSPFETVSRSTFSDAFGFCLPYFFWLFMPTISGDLNAISSGKSVSV
jgi:hypothetical protein